MLLTLFAALALVLAFVGLYGVVAHGVTQRTREIGIRMAVGAQQRDVLTMVIRQGMQPAVAGLVLGLLAAFGLARVLASQLYEVSPRDPATFALWWALVCWSLLSVPALSPRDGRRASIR